MRFHTRRGLRAGQRRRVVLGLLALALPAAVLLVSGALAWARAYLSRPQK